jgi:hypothetical protein
MMRNFILSAGPIGQDDCRLALGVQMRRVALVAESLVIVAAVALAVVRFFAIDSGSHSASDTLRPWLIQVFVIAVVAAVLVTLVDRLAQRFS